MLHVLHRGDEDIIPSTSTLNIHTAFSEMCNCWREHFIKCAAAHFHTKSVQNQFEVEHELQLPIYPCRSCRKSKSVFLYISLSYLQKYFHLLSFVFDKNVFAFVSLCLKSSGTHPNNPSHDRCKATVEHFTRLFIIFPEWKIFHWLLWWCCAVSFWSTSHLSLIPHVYISWHSQTSWLYLIYTYS